MVFGSPPPEERTPALRDRNRLDGFVVCRETGNRNRETMKSRDEIDALLKAAAEAGLEGLDFAAEFDYETIALKCSDVESELSRPARRVLARYLSTFEPAMLIYDLRLATPGSGGPREARAEFLRNCGKMFVAASR